MKRGELTCMKCGFVTYSNLDMILHLACGQVYEEENCEEKVIEISDSREVTKNGTSKNKSMG